MIKCNRCATLSRSLHARDNFVQKHEDFINGVKLEDISMKDLNEIIRKIEGERQKIADIRKIHDCKCFIKYG